MKNLTPIQWLGITLIVLGALTGSTAQLTTLFGATVTPIIVSASTLLMSILGGVVTFIGGQSSQLAAVQAMPGVEKIVVNSMANGTLATMTVDPTNNKIESLPGSQQAVEATAKAAA